ncbi:hypothetical protein [Phenylobacterium sp.]|uniref:hypothetical protein n=1 Tax=Phenylobacterium sp. TaxID=1871053 RepID=UPI0035B42BDB
MTDANSNAPPLFGWAWNEREEFPHELRDVLATIIRAKECQNCGKKFGSEFIITLNEALRVGAIVRGVDVEEGEVRDGEEMAGEFHKFVMRSGDAQMLKLAKLVPDELLGRFANFIDAARKSKEDP